MTYARPRFVPACFGPILVTLLVCCTTLGCVRRRMLIRTNPPGALVYVDDYEIGTTPIATDFTYYGKRKIRLVKDGYETKTVMQPVRAPWYQIPPLDFVSENLVPWKIRDHRQLDFQMSPQMVVPTEQLLSRAEGLRRSMPVPGGPPPTPGASPGALPGTIPAPPPTSETIPTPPPVGGQPMHALPE